MKEMCEKLCSLNHPRAGPCEIGIRVHRIDTAVPYCRKIGPTGIRKESLGLFRRFLHMEATRHHDQNFWRPSQNVIPSDTN